MKLTVQIKLLPTKEQEAALSETVCTANKAATRIARASWAAKKLHRFAIHRANYTATRKDFALSAQMVVRVIAKVADAFKTAGKAPKFRDYGSISYDNRILSFNLKESTVSIWTMPGRTTVPFVCGEHQRKLLEFPRGESDLLKRDKAWFLFVTVTIPDTKERQVVGWLGCDLGIKNILTDSDGANYSGSHLASLRHRHARLRTRLQSKGTKSAKRLLAKRRRKESRFSRDVNHVISKRVVAKAECTDRGIALENLTHIRSRIKAPKPQRRQLNSWAFYDLQTKILYKAALAGVPVRLVDPGNTSRKCPACGHTAKANRKTRDSFSCKACGFSGDADNIAAENISRAAIVPPNVGVGCVHPVF